MEFVYIRKPRSKRATRLPQYAHKISYKTLEKWKLNVTQMMRVYSFKTKAEQEAQAKRFRSSNKAVRAKKFQYTALGEYNRQLKIEKYGKLGRQATDKATKEKYGKKIFQLHMKSLDYREYRRKKELKNAPLQEREWLEQQIKAIQDQKRHIQDKINALLNEKIMNKDINIYGPFVNDRSSRQSYKQNNTSKVALEDFLLDKYANEYETLTQGIHKIDKYGRETDEWEVPPVSHQEAIDALRDKALEEKVLEPLKQNETTGITYGYIDQTSGEVISPV